MRGCARKAYVTMFTDYITFNALVFAKLCGPYRSRFAHIEPIGEAVTSLSIRLSYGLTGYNRKSKYLWLLLASRASQLLILMTSCPWTKHHLDF